MEQYLQTEEFLDKILNAKSVFGFFINDAAIMLSIDDWYVPQKEKRWVKFSFNPFDIDFLEFHYLGKGIIDNDGNTRIHTELFLKYLNISKNPSKLGRLINDTYFRGGYITNSVSQYNSNHYTNYKPSKIYSLKNRITNAIKTWIKRIYEKYNFFNKSLEYIAEYYKNWVILVDKIQKEFDSNTKINSIYDFIEEFNIKDTMGFLQIWYGLVLPGKLDIEGIEKDISKKFYDKLLYSYKFNGGGVE